MAEDCNELLCECNPINYGNFPNNNCTQRCVNHTWVCAIQDCSQNARVTNHRHGFLACLQHAKVNQMKAIILSEESKLSNEVFPEVNKVVEKLFCDLTDKYKLESGDETPDQHFSCNKLEVQLTNLLVEWIKQNRRVN